MERSTREIEIKLRFASVDDARRGVEKLGAELARARHFEDNRVFDSKDAALRAADKLLRLRRAGERAVLTLKTPVEGTYRHKVREEHETNVADADATAGILRGLGFEPCFRYQKYRTVYRLEGLTIALDETPLGCFVELEGPPDEIDRAATRLGFEPRHYVRETYGELHELDARRRGVPFGDLLLDNAESGRPS